MTRPTANTEAGGAKILILSDSTATTPAAKNPAAPIISVSGDANSNVGWLAVCTAGDGDTLGTPGVGTFVTKDSAGTAKAPVMLMAGADGVSATETSRIHRPFRVHEGGALLTMPGSAYTAAAAFMQPLMAVGGVLAVSAVQTNLALTTTLASNFGYMTSIQVIAVTAGVGKQTLQVLDASGGTQRWGIDTGTALTFTAGQVINFVFPTPIRTNAAGAAFFLTTTAATTQAELSITCNGYFSTAV